MHQSFGRAAATTATMVSINMVLAVSAVFALFTISACEGKHDYKIELQKVEINAVNMEYTSKESALRAKMYNDTMTVVEGSLIVTKDLPDDLIIQVVGFQLSSTNQWIKNIDQGQKKYCDYLTENISFMQNVLKASNFESCPPKEGVWTLTDMIVDVSPFPESLPEDKWKINVVLTSKMVEVLDIDVYADIVKVDDDDDDE